MRAFIASLYSFALSLGGPGLFAVAALDSSFVSLPQINDLLVVLMVTQNKAWMPYYAAMATLGSLAGCSVIYFLANKGGEALLRRRVASHRVDHTLEQPRIAVFDGFVYYTADDHIAKVDAYQKKMDADEAEKEPEGETKADKPAKEKGKKD